MKRLKISPLIWNSSGKSCASESGRDPMLRLGSKPNQSREMDLDDIFLSRLKLLVIMGKSYIEGCPCGRHRRRAMLENARHIESESIDLGGLVTGSAQPTPTWRAMEFDHIFFQRVKLLAVMIKAIGKGFPMGEHRKQAMQENIDIICETITFNNQSDMPFLKVA
ncbi:MAG: hypothetical protein P8X96_06615 [Desulfobacteraceae bacterium]